MKKLLSLFLVLALLTYAPDLAFAVAQNVDNANENHGDDGDPTNDGVVFAGDNTLAVGDNLNIGDTAGLSIDPGADNQGTVNFAGTSTVSGTIGTGAADDLKALNANGGVGETVTLSGNAFIVTTSLGGAGTLDLDGSLTGTTLNFGADGTTTLADNQNITAAITTTTGGEGTLTLEGTSTITGQVGTNGNRLKVVNGGAAGEVATFANDVFAVTTNVSGTGTLDLDGSLTGTTLDFDADGTVALADNQNITAAITTTTGGEGTLTLAGTSTITGQVGTNGNRLKVVNGGAAGEVATFANDVFAVTTNVSGTGTLDLDGSLTGTTLDFDGDGTATVADDQNLTAAVTTSAGDGTGTLTFEGTTTATGTVGANGAALKTINAGAAGETVAFNGDIFATTLSVTGAGTVTFADGTDFTGAISAAADGSGTLTYLGASTTAGTVGSAGNALSAVNVNGGIVSLANNIFATTTTVNTGGTLTPTGDRTITGALTLAGTGIANIAANTLTVTGIYTQGANAQLNVTVTDSSTAGQISSTGNAVVNANSTVSVTADTYLADGVSFTVIDGAGGAGVNVPTITDNNSFVSFSGSASNGDLIITVNRDASFDTVATTANGAATGTAFDSAAATLDSDLLAVGATLESLSTDEINTALDSMDPDVSLGNVQTSTASLNAFLNTIGTHLSGFNDVVSTGSTGMASGDALEGLAIWIQGFGHHSKQGHRKGVDGYDADVFGTAIGGDVLVDEDLRVGAAFGYAQSDIDARSSIASQTDITSYQASLYSRYEGMHDERPYYINGLLSFAHNEYDSSRDIIFTNVNRTASADYSGQQYSAKVEAGYTFEQDDLDITPFASLHYSHLHIRSYTEEGAGSLNLNVDDQDYDFMEQELGIRIAYPWSHEKSVITPSIYTSWVLEYFGDRQETTSSFTAGGSSFSTRGADPAQNSLKLGGELKLVQADRLSLAANYDLELRDEYVGHSYYGTVRFEI